MRVLHAMAGQRHGGAEAFFARLVVALARRGLDQRALARPDPARRTALAEAGVETRDARFGGPLDVLTPLRFRRLVASYRPDVVLTWMTRATVACPRGRFAHVARLGGYYDLGRYRRCDHLAVNTQGLRDWAIRQGWAADRVHFIANFVDAAPVAPAERRAFDTPDDAPVLLGLGRLHPNKAFDVSIDALAELPRAILWLAGAGPLDAELKALAQRRGVAGRVRFLGWRDDAGALIAAANVVVCPSRREPLGNVVLEAWARGTPVVAARSAGPAELISDGSDGLLVDIEDARGLAAAARRVLDDPGLARSLAAAGRARHDADFTEDAVVGRYLALFAAVAG